MAFGEQPLRQPRNHHPVLNTARHEVDPLTAYKLPSARGRVAEHVPDGEQLIGGRGVGG